MKQLLAPADLGRRLRLVRHHTGLKQVAVAQRVGCSDVALSHWECGKSTPPLLFALALAEVYGMSIEDLVCVSDGKVRWE